jgi:hypothetical protein
MDPRTSFDQLLATAANGDLEGLRAKRTALDQEKADLLFKLAEVTLQIRELDAKIMTPVRNAVKAAQLLNVEVPAEYRSGIHNGNGGGQSKRSKGKFSWQSNGMVPFQAEVSRAMWRLSSGSGGSAGKKGEGVLSGAEFWALAKLDESKLKLGEKNTITLPNSKVVTFQKTEE